MKIAFNARTLTFEPGFRNSGIARYTKELLFALAALDKSNEQNEYFAFAPKKSIEITKKLRFIPKSFSFKKSAEEGRHKILLWEQLLFPLAIKKVKADLLHCPTDVAPLAVSTISNSNPNSTKIVLTIHDLIHKLLPSLYTVKRKFYFNTLMPLSAKKASHIICISENTKNDLLRFLKIPEEKISVIYEAASSVFRQASQQEKEAVKRKYSLNRFILFAGILEPKKGIPCLIKAFNALKAKANALKAKANALKAKAESEFSDLKLVLVGGKGWLYDEIFRTAKESPFLKDIVFTGWIPDEELAALYSSADCFVFPSIYEGFGLPPLEAMSCKCPVITSRVSSLPEVCGKAALYIRPNNTADLIKALEEVLSSSRIRSSLERKGLRQARRFSWKKTAKQTLAVYEKLGRN